jgi:hypothetical protein
MEHHNEHEEHGTTKELMRAMITAINALRDELQVWRETSVPIKLVAYMFLILVLSIGGLKAIDRFMPSTLIAGALAEGIK